MSDKIFGEYKSNNPKFSFFNFLLKGEHKYIYTKQSPAGATAHETLGHAADYVTGGRYYDEYSALRGENLYHKAANEPSRDVY